MAAWASGRASTGFSRMILSRALMSLATAKPAAVSPVKKPIVFYDIEVYPNLWAGVGLVRGGAGTALVGSHEEVAALISEYHDLGFDEFILSGYPHLEEAYWFAEGVLPLLRKRGALAA